MSFNVQTRNNSYIKRTIRLRQTYIVKSKELTKLPIIYYDNLFNNKDFLFESQCFYNLDYKDNVYAYVVNVNLNKILIRNTTLRLIILTRRIRFETITKYNQINYYLVMSNEHYKIASKQINNKL